MPHTLSSLREEIDAIDDQLLSLLMRRLAVVQQVGVWKESQGGAYCPIRSAREALLIKRIAAASHDSLLSPAAAATIWRHIINAALMVEGRLSLATHVQAACEAQAYFGSYLPCTTHPTTHDVIEAVVREEAMVGIVPAQTSEAWWQQMVKYPDIQVFAALPYIGASPRAYAFAKLQAEASGEDFSLYVNGNQLVQVAGFQPAGEHGAFIGAFAAPILT